MKSFLELAAARQSDRTYEPGRVIEREALERILEAGRLAPSACNGQPWHFTVVTDPQLLVEVGKATSSLGMNRFVKDASALVLITLAPTNITVHSFSVKNAADIRKKEGFSLPLGGGDAAKSVEYSQLRTKNAGYRPYYMYRQKNTVGNLENVGYSIEGHEGLYNVFMMEELHSIFAVGAAAVTKLVHHCAPRAGTSKIQRIFTPKYPYEYLRDAEKIRMGDEAEGLPSLAQRIRAFYEKNEG